MTIMSQVNAEKFSELARVVFPQNTVFDPADYLEVFNLRRPAPLGGATFRKYVSIISESEYFPNLKRKRSRMHVGDKYIIEPILRKQLSPDDVSVSDAHLAAFVGRMKFVVRRNTWYKPETLRRYYNRGPHRKLKGKTFSYYMSLAFRRGIWEGLSRKREGKVFRYSWVSEENVTVTPSVECEAVAPLKDHYLAQTTCATCGGHSPVSAKFCMHCGSSLGLSVRVAVQEDFFPMVVPVEDVTEKEMVLAVRGAMLQWLESCDIRKCGGENNIVTYTVSGEKRGKS